MKFYDNFHARILVSVAIAIAFGGTMGHWWTREPLRRLSSSGPMDPRTGCGAVSLSLMSHWIGSPRSIEQFTEMLDSGETGVSSLPDMKRVWRDLGYSAEVVQLIPSQYKKSETPLIIYVNKDHFVFAAPASRGRLILANPPDSPRVVSSADLINEWDGIALVPARTEQELTRALGSLGVSTHK